MYTQDEQNRKVDTALAIGQALFAAREASGMSLQDVAERTRISMTHLKALETGNFETLPGVGYIPGFIRNYCQAVGIEASPHVDSFKSISSVATKKPEYSFPVQALVPRVAGSMIAMFAVLVGLTVYVGWTFISYNQTAEPELIASSISQVDQPELLLENNPAQPEGTADEQPSAPGQMVSDAAAVQPAVPQTSVREADLQTQTASGAAAPVQPEPPAAVSPPEQEIVTPQAETVADNTPQIAPETDAPKVDIAEADAPANVAVGGDDQTQTAALSPDQTAGTNAGSSLDQAGTTPVVGVGAQATQRLPGEEVIIRATASSWIEVTRADGEVLVTKLMRQGDRLVFSSDENLFLSTGNAGGLRLEMPNIAAFDAGQTGEILRDLRLNRESIQNRQLLASY